MKYKSTQKLLLVLALVLGSVFLTSSKVSAGAICPDGNPPHITVVARLIQSSPVHSAPESVKDNVQMCINKYGALTYGPFWLEPASYTGTGIKSSTAWAAILIHPSVSYSQISQGKIVVIDSTNNFLVFPSGCSKTFDIGTVERGKSEGASRSCVKVNTAKLASGTREMCVRYTMSNVTNGRTLSDTGSWCGNITYTPTSAPQGTISANCSQISIYARDGDNLSRYMKAKVDFSGGFPTLGPVTANRTYGSSSGFNYQWTTPTVIKNSTSRVTAVLSVQDAITGVWTKVDTAYIGPCSTGPTATITPDITVSPTTISEGQSATFRSRVDTSNVANTASTTFKATSSHVSSPPSGVSTGADRNYVASIAGGNPRVNSPESIITYDKAGTYCRKLTITEKPSYAAATSDTACVTVKVDVSDCMAAGNPSAKTNLDPYLQPGDSATLTLTFRPSTQLTYTIPPGFGSASGTRTVVLPPGTTSYNVALTAASAPNEYTVTWKINTATGDDCSDTINVVTLPYFNAYGKGVIAGGEFKSVDGTCKGEGTLGGWFDNTSNGYGSSSQLSALALVKIVGLASAQTSMGRSPTNLTFANNSSDISTDKTSPSLGGNFYGAGGASTGSSCLTEPEEPDTTADSGSTFSIASSSGAYSHDGDVTISGGQINIGENISLFAKGDVYISNDIRYQAGWGITDVPSFVLVATGNIYIDSTVTQLDGLYVAKNDSTGGSKGRIFTCAKSPPSSLYSADELYNNCKKQLTVYGSFIANKVNLLRTYGTLSDGKTGLKQGSACFNFGGNISPRVTCAAEVFDFSPEMYLSKPAVKPPSNGANQYDSITSLPPVL